MSSLDPNIIVFLVMLLIVIVFGALLVFRSRRPKPNTQESTGILVEAIVVGAGMGISLTDKVWEELGYQNELPLRVNIFFEGKSGDVIASVSPLGDSMVSQRALKSIGVIKEPHEKVTLIVRRSVR